MCFWREGEKSRGRREPPGHLLSQRGGDTQLRASAATRTIPLGSTQLLPHRGIHRLTNIPEFCSVLSRGSWGTLRAPSRSLEEYSDRSLLGTASGILSQRHRGEHGSAYSRLLGTVEKQPTHSSAMTQWTTARPTRPTHVIEMRAISVKSTERDVCVKKASWTKNGLCR